MIHNDVLNQLQLLVKTSAPPLVEVSQTPLEEPQWVPGQRLNALVLANLPNGRFQVQVGEMMLDMNLPRNTQPGDNVELTFVASQPRLTFILSRDLAGIAANGSPETKSQVTLSDTARFLGALIQKIADQAGPMAPLTKSAPLMASAPTDIKEFSSVLRTALSQSGLFYESHQAQWVAGERTLSDLLREPQGRLSAGISGVGAAEIQPKNVPASAQSEPGAAETQPGNRLATSQSGLAASEAQPGNRPASAQVDGAIPQGTSKLPVHAEALSLVQQQLQTLDTRQLVWQGQVWPGQVMEWRVEERNPREGGAEADLPHWQTSLRLQLPRLGKVQASLSFMPQGLRVDLKADEETAEIMKGAQDRLRGSMEASGLHLLGLTVERNEKA